MFKNFIFALVVMAFVSSAVFSQQPPRPRQGPPSPAGPPKNQETGGWIRPHDTNQNDILEQEEFIAAVERTFVEVDTNKNGTLEITELQRLPRPMDRQPPRPVMGGEQPMAPNRMGPRPGENARALLPPFFFEELVGKDKAITRAEFEAAVQATFKDMDRNADGAVGRFEAGGVNVMKGPGPGPKSPPPPPNARFLSAELSFGDKLVAGQPFSAETVVEHTRRLFDGSTVKKEMNGAIYRDAAGRTRREQPLDVVGGMSVNNQNTKPIRLIFINDFPGKFQYSFEASSKIARKTPIWSNHFPFPDKDEPSESRSESVGTRTIEGVSCEMTRTEREIPIGAIGNDKPLKSVSERCFSPELQLVIMSVNNDPIGGNHVFRLKNIKRVEPASELFTVPAGYKIETGNYK